MPVPIVLNKSNCFNSLSFSSLLSFSLFINSFVLLDDLEIVKSLAIDLDKSSCWLLSKFGLLIVGKIRALFVAACLIPLPAELCLESVPFVAVVVVVVDNVVEVDVETVEAVEKADD